MLKDLLRISLNATWGVLKRTLVGLAQESVVKKVKDVICFNQGWLMKYNYLAGELHKDLRIAVGNNDEVLIKKAKEALDKHLAEGIERACLANFTSIIKILTEQKGVVLDDEPRVCLKVHYLTHERSGDQLITVLFRSNKENYESECRADENTSSRHVHQTGDYHLCNNIPRLAERGKYMNPRFNKNALENYSPPYWFSPRRWGVDKKWKNVWERVNDLESPTRACYRSTLVIPCTLAGNSLVGGHDFFKKLAQKGVGTGFFSEDLAEEHIEKHVYGYLCLDHARPEFFNDKFDLFIGYLFADLLSLYLVAFLTYTKLSDTYMRLEDVANG